MVLDPLGIDARRIDADADRQQEILDDAMLAAGVLGHRPALGGEEDAEASRLLSGMDAIKTVNVARGTESLLRMSDASSRRNDSMDSTAAISAHAHSTVKPSSENRRDQPAADVSADDGATGLGQ